MILWAIGLPDAGSSFSLCNNPWSLDVGSSRIKVMQCNTKSHPLKFWRMLVVGSEGDCVLTARKNVIN